MNIPIDEFLNQDRTRRIRIAFWPRKEIWKPRHPRVLLVINTLTITNNEVGTLTNSCFQPFNCSPGGRSNFGRFIVNPTLPNFVFASQCIHTRAIATRGNHPSQLSEQSIINILGPSKTQTPTGSWGTQIRPSFLSQKSPRFTTWVPPEVPDSSIHLLANRNRHIIRRKCVRR
jgi:hypothetical protein